MQKINIEINTLIADIISFYRCLQYIINFDSWYIHKIELASVDKVIFRHQFPKGANILKKSAFTLNQIKLKYEWNKTRQISGLSTDLN